MMGGSGWLTGVGFDPAVFNPLAGHTADRMHDIAVQFDDFS